MPTLRMTATTRPNRCELALTGEIGLDGAPDTIFLPEPEQGGSVA
jgi:hypothetical protein